jgi:hypothetical protein
MKKISIIFSVVFALFSFVVKAQSDDTFDIKIVTKKDGKLTVKQKSITTNGLTKAERDAKISKEIADITKNIEPSEIQSIQFGDQAKNKPEKTIAGFSFDSDDFKVDMDAFEKDLKEGLEKTQVYIHRFFDNDSLKMSSKGGNSAPRPRINVLSTDASTTVKGLKVYTNIPANNNLNVSFNTTATADVTISVLNLEGKIVAKEVIKNHSGAYMGQVSAKLDKGVYFVLVSQNGDGSTKRIEIK